MCGYANFTLSITMTYFFVEEMLAAKLSSKRKCVYRQAL